MTESKDTTSIPVAISGIDVMRGVGAVRAKGFWADAWGRVLKRPGAIFGMCWIGVIAFSIRYSVADAMTTTLAQNPGVAMALLSIDDASIGIDVADNGRLPQLDLETSGALYGLSSGFGDSWQELGDNDWLEWAVGATFRQPIGNRAAEAEYRQARLARSRSVIIYKTAVQSAVLDVRNALQDAFAAYRLIAQTRAQRLAAAENMRALALGPTIDLRSPERRLHSNRDLALWAVAPDAADRRADCRNRMSAEQSADRPRSRLPDPARFVHQFDAGACSRRVNCLVERAGAPRL